MQLNRLSEIRNNKGVTQVEVANALQISRSAYSMYEAGHREMNYESLCFLADYFGVSIDTILGRDNSTIFLVSDEEKEILNKYRALDQRGQENIKGLISLESKHIKKTSE